MEEIWKDVPGYFGLYQASNLGRIKSFNKNKKPSNFTFCYLSPVLNTRGYMFVNLSGKQKKRSRVIMETFCGPSLLQVNHINGVKIDDRLSNLEYVTASENIIHAYKYKLMKNGELHHKNVLKKDHVLSIFYDNRSERIIAREYGVSQVTINRIKRKLIWKHLWNE